MPNTGRRSKTAEYGASGSGAPVGRVPVSAPIATSRPPNAQTPSRARCARSAGPNGSARRRPRTIRSTTPRANGTTPRTRTSRAVQPLAARSEKKMLSGVRNAPPTLVSREPTSASVARPSCPSRLRGRRHRIRAVGIGRERDGGELGREEAPLLVQRERNAEIDELSRNGRKGGVHSDLLGYAVGRRANERARGRHGVIARDRQARASLRQVVEHDDCDGALCKW